MDAQWSLFVCRNFILIDFQNLAIEEIRQVFGLSIQI